MSKWELLNPITSEHVLYDGETGAPVYFDSSEKALEVIETCKDDGLTLILLEIK